MSAAQLLIFIAVLVGAVLLIRRARLVTVIYPPRVGLLYRNGRFVRELPPGRYTLFDLLSRSRIVPVSLAELPIPLGEATVLSKDQFSFRLTLAPVLKVADARLFLESQGGPDESTPPHLLVQVRGHTTLHSVVPAAALEAAATLTLAEMLANQDALRTAIHAKVKDAVPGATVDQLLLTAINLPPETRRMFTDVERAKMEAQASLERARGEQASLRVLANAARMLADNSSLGTLRLLQAIDSSKGNATIVIGDAAGAGLGLGKPSPAA
jgi:regulator of protease activity HflC (stomatin/prohibitin superfamily)